jgi:hypothetical protein
MQHVVVWDPSDEYWEGAVVDQIKVNELQGRGAVTLPCKPELFRYAGVSGYSRRSWGSGWPLDTVVPRLVCPLTMFISEDAPKNLNWCARIGPAAEALHRINAGKEAAQGVLRMAGHEQRGTLRTPVVTDGPMSSNTVEISKLGELDAFGGWTVRGRAKIHVMGEGCYGLSLFGFAPGLKILWVAASLST